MALGICHRAPSFAAVSPETLYHQAYVKETSDRDPESAIPLYKEAIATAGPQNPLTSKAHYRIGRCAELLGREAEAVKAYQAALENQPPRDLERDIESRLQILQRPAAITIVSTAAPSGPVLSLRWLERWTLSIAPGDSSPLNNEILGGQLHRSVVLQGAALYRWHPSIGAGFELGYSFGHSLDFPSSIQPIGSSPPSYTLKVFQFTPVIEWGHAMSLGRVSFRPVATAGFGLYNLNQVVSYRSGNLNVVASQSNTYSGFNGGGGILFRLNPLMAIGPDLRYHHVFSSGDNFHYLTVVLRLAILL